MAPLIEPQRGLTFQAQLRPMVRRQIRAGTSRRSEMLAAGRAQSGRPCRNQRCSLEHALGQQPEIAPHYTEGQNCAAIFGDESG
jgi:hypothetical protein